MWKLEMSPLEAIYWVKNFILFLEMWLLDFEKSQGIFLQIRYLSINNLLNKALSTTNKNLFAVSAGIQKNNGGDAFETKMHLLTPSYKVPENSQWEMTVYGSAAHSSQLSNCLV